MTGRQATREMNKGENCKEKRRLRQERRRKDKARKDDTHPHAGLTPRCKRILELNRFRLRDECRANKRTRATSGMSRQNKTLRRTMAS